MSNGGNDSSETSYSIVLLLTICEMCRRSFKFNTFLQTGLEHWYKLIKHSGCGLSKFYAARFIKDGRLNAFYLISRIFCLRCKRMVSGSCQSVDVHWDSTEALGCKLRLTVSVFHPQNMRCLVKRKPNEAASGAAICYTLRFLLR